MNGLTTKETFDLRKAIIEKFGLTEQSNDIWFKVILPNSRVVERLKKLLDGQTDTFSFTGKQLRTEILGEKND